MSNKILDSIKGLALFSLVLALSAAAFIAPGPAAAATCNPVGMGPQACTSVSVHVYNRIDGSPVDNAKVELVDSQGAVTYAFDLAQVGGMYSANVTPDTYTIVVRAPDYLKFSTQVEVRMKPTQANAPLMPSTLSGSGGSTN